MSPLALDCLACPAVVGSRIGPKTVTQSAPAMANLENPLLLQQREAWNQLLAAFRGLGWLAPTEEGPAPSDKQLLLFQLPDIQNMEWFVKELLEAEPALKPGCRPGLLTPGLPYAKRSNWRLYGLSCMFHAWQGGHPLQPMCETCGAPCGGSICNRCDHHLCPDCKGGKAMIWNYEDGNCRQCN